MRKMLEGQTAVVTGASKGIGYAIAELFSEEGANVVITARHQGPLDEAAEKIRAKGGKVLTVVADSADREAPARVFKEAIDAFGQVDIMVNNAGVGEMYAVEKTTDDHFDNIMQINLAGPFRFCREAINHMMPRNEGRIINVSSVNGTLPICGVAYTTTKGGLNTMTLNMAIRLSGTKIRVNAIAPGVTDTDAARAWAAGEQEGGGEMLEFSDKYTNTTVPSTEPIDQAYAALYLASDMGRAVTGQVIQVDNGQFI
ncbi:SDR family NAD(P)-dependent oxidoreductase [Pseudooceanicola marinus]|uniref:SDR family NAD(P)-dependent oxidoreductase n=1 Tax=Pseudooceanicola marinus TaxID=396013 RepID=UPI001CD3CECD|nr:SDR family oxidoreductase [Pseudooceanicola marinus]MCA1336906.1 SDR family oxidoreductase [Pseudooceanicola marinus]